MPEGKIKEQAAYNVCYVEFIICDSRTYKMFVIRDIDKYTLTFWLAKTNKLLSNPKISKTPKKINWLSAYYMTLYVCMYYKCKYSILSTQFSFLNGNSNSNSTKFFSIPSYSIITQGVANIFHNGHESKFVPHMNMNFIFINEFHENALIFL